jgi:IS30 family transposase
MVERTSKLTKLVLLPRRTADEVGRALMDSLNSIKEFVHTLTADNGKEFAGHVTVAKALEAEFYFAKPYHSWERGLNEHTNGLVRQYFPKAMRFDEITEEMLMEVEILLNNRPRKILAPPP